MYNLFRIAGDLMHLASIFILLLKIYSSQKCTGKWAHTQALTVYIRVCVCVCEMCRNILEDAVFIRVGVCVPLFGFIFQFRVAVQFGDENCLHWVNLHHRILDEV